MKKQILWNYKKYLILIIYKQISRQPLLFTIIYICLICQNLIEILQIETKLKSFDCHYLFNSTVCYSKSG